MQIFKLRKNKKKKAFTLIEVLVGLAILSIIGVFVFPSLTSLFKNSMTHKDQARIIFAMEEAIEVAKDEKPGDFIHEVNGIKVEVSITDYGENHDFKDIRARFADKELRLVAPYD